MKSFYLFLFILFSFTGSILAQQKSTGDITLITGMTANFTLDNDTSKVTLVLTGPMDRWFSLGFGSSVVSGFGMSSGDVLIYTETLTDRHYSGYAIPPTDASQDWSTISDTTSGGTRTLTLERDLETGDSNDTQLPFASTNSIMLAWAMPASASTSLAYHGPNGKGFATGTFEALGVSDAESTKKQIKIYPNPANEQFEIQSKTEISSILIYSTSGEIVSSFKARNTYNISHLPKGVYFVEIILENAQVFYKKLIKQ